MPSRVGENIIYTRARKTAIFRARFEWDWTYQEIEEASRAGKLGDEGPLPARWQRIGTLCREERKRRAGQIRSPLAEKPHRDAIEELRQRCVSVADDMLMDLHYQARRKPGQLDPKRLQEAIRAVTMAAALPGRHEPPPLAPGQGSNKDGRRPTGERIRNKGPLLDAMRAVQAEGPRGGGPPNPAPASSPS